MGLPGSVLDVGCGTGEWLKVWRQLGVNDVDGVDGWEETPFRQHDLRRPLDLSRRFDLVESVEVAEHLPESAAGTFVDSLTRHGEVVLFSAALPGQGGKGHMNEQPPTYWANHFAQRGYEVFDMLRWRVWDDPRVAGHYRQNLLLFARGEPARRLGACAVERSMDVAHPEMLDSFGVRRTWSTARKRFLST